MLIALAWLTAAASPVSEGVEEAGCELLTAPDLLVGLELADALARQDNSAAYREVVQTLETDIECVDFEVDSEDLGRLFWHRAASIHPAAGWQGALTTMERVAPRTVRSVTHAQELSDWTPGAPPVTTPAYDVEDNARILVDGSPRLQFFELPPDGDHLVQYWERGRLVTRFLPAGEALAEDGPGWRYVTPYEDRLRRNRARRVSVGIAGGSVLVAIAGGVVVTQATREITASPSSERDRLLKRRTAGHVLLGAGAVTALTSLGVGWGVRW